MKSININFEDEKFNPYGLKKSIGSNHKTDSKELTKKGAIYLGDTKIVQQEEAYLKKVRNQKKAMKAVLEQFATDDSIDEEQKNRQKRIEELMGQSNEQIQQIQQLQARKEEILSSGAVTEGSEEQKAIEELDETIQQLYSKVAINNEDSANTLKDIHAVTLARDKSHPMTDAEKEKEKKLSAASDSLVNSLLGEAKDTIDEKIKNEKEEAEKIKEEKEAKEEQELQQMENQAKLNSQMQEINSKVTAKQLLEEDIKGIAVDENL